MDGLNVLSFSPSISNVVFRVCANALRVIVGALAVIASPYARMQPVDSLIMRDGSFSLSAGWVVWGSLRR